MKQRMDLPASTAQDHIQIKLTTVALTLFLKTIHF